MQRALSRPDHTHVEFSYQEKRFDDIDVRLDSIEAVLSENIVRLDVIEATMERGFARMEELFTGLFAQKEM